MALPRRHVLPLCAAVSEKHLVRVVAWLEEPLGLVMEFAEGAPIAEKPNLQARPHLLTSSAWHLSPQPDVMGPVPSTSLNPYPNKPVASPAAAASRRHWGRQRPQCTLTPMACLSARLLVFIQKPPPRPALQSLLRCRWAPSQTFSLGWLLRVAIGVAGALEHMHYRQARVRTSTLLQRCVWSQAYGPPVQLCMQPCTLLYSSAHGPASACCRALLPRCPIACRGIAHGDVYAHNVMADETGHATLCDYGACTLLGKPLAPLPSHVSLVWHMPDP